MSGRGSVWRENALVPITRNGRKEDVFWTYSYAPIDDPSSPTGVGGVLVICAETTQTVKTLRRIADERHWFAELFEQSPSFMAMLEGPEHVFQMINPAFSRLIGCRRVIGLPIRQALPEAAAQGYVQLLDHVFQTGRPYATSGETYRFESPGGGPEVVRTLDFLYQPLRNEEGLITGVFVEGFDFSARRS